MKQYIKYLFISLGMTFVLLETIVIGVIIFPKGIFHSSFQSVIVDKYRILQNTNEPKIIVVSGSSSCFGLDQKMLEEETGYKVVNLGLHGGFGPRFYTELSKENINERDIVLLGYEYGWQHDLDNLGQDLIMSGIDDNLDMYKHIPPSHWKDFVGYIFKYAEKKYSYEGASGLYSREAFDSNTYQMIAEREYVMDYPNNVDVYGNVNIKNVKINDFAIDYLKDYKAYVEKRGARVFFVSPPVLKQAITCDYKEFDNLKQQEEEKIGIPFISNPEDYFFEDELMSDSIYHCSTKGEKVRTELLISDLKRAGVVE